jgi:hypothetical protein
MNHPAGQSGFWYCSIVSSWESVNGTQATGELRIDLNIDNGHVDEAVEVLRSRQEEIEAELAGMIPEGLIWHRKEGVRTARLYVRRDADVLQREMWPEYREWLLSRFVALDKVFRPRIESMTFGG